MIAVIYKLNEFTASNGKVNKESLEMEIRASAVSGLISADGIKGAYYIHFPNVLTDDETLILDDIIANHDGIESRTTDSLRQKREGLIDELIGRSYNHPVLKNFPNEISVYTTAIDNHINAWVRDGNETTLVTKIMNDSVDTANESHEFLNRVVNYEGNTTAQFLASSIPTTPFI